MNRSKEVKKNQIKKKRIYLHKKMYSNLSFPMKMENRGESTLNPKMVRVVSNTRKIKWITFFFTKWLKIISFKSKF